MGAPVLGYGFREILKENCWAPPQWEDWYHPLCDVGGFPLYFLVIFSLLCYEFLLLTDPRLATRELCNGVHRMQAQCTVASWRCIVTCLCMVYELRPNMLQHNVMCCHHQCVSVPCFTNARHAKQLPFITVGLLKIVKSVAHRCGTEGNEFNIVGLHRDYIITINTRGLVPRVLNPMHSL